MSHVAVQYAKTMDLHVTAVDVDDAKFALARRLGADLAVNCATANAVAVARRATGGGAHGVLVTTVSVPAFGQAIAMARRRER